MPQTYIIYREPHIHIIFILPFWYLFARHLPCKPPSQLVAGEGNDVCHNEPGLPRLRDVGARLQQLGHPMQRHKYAVNNKSPTT